MYNFPVRINKTRWRKLWQARRRDAATLSLILPVFAAMFGAPILRGKSFALYDAFAYSYPLRTVAWNELRHGRLPLWTPLIMSGYPMLSMAQLALGYPLTWGYAFLPGYIAEQIYVLAPYVLTPIFVYHFAREIGRSRPAALLAGLAYGYGGLGITGFPHNGMLTNAMMWLPLMLTAIERARTKSFARCVLGATLAYTMSVLTGIGQGFLYVGILAAAYALFISLAATESGDRKNEFGETENAATHNDWFAWKRWKPFAVAVCAIILSAGVAAFQIFETMPAAQSSVRSTLSYQTFVANSFTLSRALRSLFVPVGLTVYYFDASAYITPFAIALAICAAAFAVRSNQRDARIFFWLVTAMLGWTLMLGSNTPVYPLLYQVPLLNRFRLSPRHTFEWTFAISILSAYGWDALDQFFLRRAAINRHRRRALTFSLVSLALALIVGARWFTTAGSLLAPLQNETAYLFWKALFVLLLLSTTWQAWKLAANTRARAVLLTSVIVLACAFEPLIIVTGWWWTIAKPLHRFTEPSPATTFLKQFPPDQNRIYTRTELFVEEYEESPVLDPANLTALYELQNVAGYEPLIMKRYSRALGNAGMDGTTTLDGSPPDKSLLGARSHVLDLLNNRFLVAYKKPLVAGNTIVKGDIKFARADNPISVKPGATINLSGDGAEADVLGLVSALAMSTNVADNMPVARLRIITADGKTIERDMRAGTDTAEWAHERTDVQANIRHSLAPVFDSRPGDDANSFLSYRYWTSLPLGERVKVDRIEATNLTGRAVLIISKATLYDSFQKRSTPLDNLTGANQGFDAERWQLVYNQERVRIFRNTRALPRVWIAKEAEVVDAEEALRRIRGEGTRDFDPRRTALLEIPPNTKIEMPAAESSAHNSDVEAAAHDVEATARTLLYEPNRILIEASADNRSVLVASEINYPGWTATIDGKNAPIYTADFLLRGVMLPAGSHLIEMRYTAPAARTGAIVSLLALFTLGGIAVCARRDKNRKN